MFTGIVTERGGVESLVLHPETDSAVLTFSAGAAAEDLGLGGSIAGNGVCLTAVSIADGRVAVDVMGETLRRTTTGELKEGRSVNLERCVPAGGRLDGHVVQGHVDAVGALLEQENVGDWDRLRFSVPARQARYIAEKGSIAVDGVSLTVTAVSEPGAEEPWFEVGLIPTTLAETSLGDKAIGDKVNLEVDVLAKYAERLLAYTAAGSQPARHAAGEPA
jgi:riboflavin synthase